MSYENDGLQDPEQAAHEQADNTFPPDFQESAVRITHHYDIGNQDVFVERRSGDVDAKRAAIYCQFKAEEWFNAHEFSNLGIAAMLVAFYGFQHTRVCECPTIDLYADREAACGSTYHELMADASLHREGMKEVMKLFVD